jgi:hypothetical protein
MLFIPSREIEEIPAKDGVKCAHCEERQASWKMKPKGGGEPVPLCGWCILYGGSEWGHLNREDLVWAGRYVQGQALGSRRKSTVIPMLDERHRLSPSDADKYVMGILFTSRILERSPLGRLTRTAAQELPDGD